MRASFLERSYRRLGPRYLPRALFVQQQLLYPVLVGAVAVLSRYVDMSVAEFVRLALLACGLQLVYSLLCLPVEHRLTRPVAEWLERDRSERTALDAWRAAASLAWRMLRHQLFTPTLGLAVWTFYLIWSVYLVWELKLPAYSGVLVYAAVDVVVFYATALRFFGIERIARPVLEDIGRTLPDGAAPTVPGLSVRTRLLGALPAINVITAVVADAVARGGNADAADLAIIVLVATAVAATVSLVLTLMLSNSISEPLLQLQGATRRIGRGDFGTRVPVVTTDETGDLARSFNEMAAGLAERERIREAFGTYLDREVAEHILREGTSLAGEEVEVTVMFLDVRDFTGFADRSPAPQVVAMLNRLFELVVPVVHSHGGHVDKFVGDGLLAVFGAPRRQKDHADKALGAAIEIARCVEERFGGELEIGIGLNSGTVVAGNIGGAGRLEFSVIGDAVNVAARVEAATRTTGDTVLIAERTRRLLKDDELDFTERPEVTLKGKRQSVTLYAPQPSSKPARAAPEATGTAQ